MGTKRKLGNTSEERQKNFEEMVYLYNEKNYSLVDIAKKYGATKQAVSLFLIKRGFTPDKEKDIKYKHFREISKNTILEEKIKMFAQDKKTQQVEKTIAQTRAKKYKQTLTEIKEITEKVKKMRFVDMGSYWDAILKKIDEVLNA